MKLKKGAKSRKRQGIPLLGRTQSQFQSSRVFESKYPHSPERRKRKSERFAQDTVNLLGSYILDHMHVHIDIPTPSPRERELLMEQTGKSDGQIAQWFARSKRKLNTKRVRELLGEELGIDHYNPPDITANFPSYGDFPKSIHEIETMSERSIIGKRRKKPLRIAPSQMELLKNIKSQMPLDSRQIDVICKLTRLPLDVIHEHLEIPLEDSPLQPLQYQVLRNAKTKHFTMDDHSMSIISKCTRLPTERITVWMDKFPKSKLSEEERSKAEDDLIMRARKQFKGRADQMRMQRPRLYFLLRESFKALGSNDLTFPRKFNAIYNQTRKQGTTPFMQPVIPHR